jgi:hypothetical protein
MCYHSMLTVCLLPAEQTGRAQGAPDYQLMLQQPWYNCADMSTMVLDCLAAG